MSILIAGTTNVAMTYLDGLYSIPVKKGETLEFSCLGLATVTQIYQGGATLNVTMQEDTIFLDDVVVVGYGTQK